MLRNRDKRKVVRTIAFDPDVFAALERRARESGTNRSSFVNRLLFAVLMNEAGGVNKNITARQTAKS
jgi:hypothetical protein